MSESVVDHYRNAGMAQARPPSELATYVSSMYYVLLTNQVLCSMYSRISKVLRAKDFSAKSSTNYFLNIRL